MALLNTIKFINMRFKTLSGYMKYVLTSDSVIMKSGKDLQTEINTINGSLSAGEQYSTEEQKVGTWIDGRTVYRKCILFGQLSSASPMKKAHGISNLDQFLHIYGSARDTSQSSRFTVTLPFVSTTSTSKNINVGGSSTDVIVYFAVDNSAYYALIVLEYLKL